MNTEITKYGFLFRGDNYCLHILYYQDNIMRLVYSATEEVPNSTDAVLASPVEVASWIENDRYNLGLFSVEVDDRTLAVKIFDQNGAKINEDLQVEPDQPQIRKKLLWEKGIYGNGEKYSWLNHLANATVNYNSDVLFHNPIQHPQVQEMHTSIPFYLGVAPGRAYGLYFDNSFRTEFDFGKTSFDLISLKAEGGILDYYFIYGSTAAEVVSAYSYLTGKPPMPDIRYLGFQQSRYSYQDQNELLAVAENLRHHQIPCDILYLDIHYMEAYKVFTVSRERFANFKATIGKLKNMGFGVVVIINPGVKAERGYRVFDEGIKNNYFVYMPAGKEYIGEVWPKPAVFPDFLRVEVREWWGEFHRELLDAGVEGIWNDMNEPSNFSLSSGTLPDEAVHRTDSGKELSHAEVHNMYGFYHTMATRKALDKIEPSKRHFVLTRAAFAGSQRYAALWTGDNSSIWEHLESSIPMILNLGLSGYSFAGADVGGYRGDCTEELLVRWTQLGAFLPFFRNHSEIGTAYQEPWNYSEKVLDITRYYISLRYRFLTYIYNLMRNCSLTGEPAVRPLFYHYQEDKKTYNINDQFLLGEGLMICPVIRPGIEQRAVYLPGGDWYDFWTDKKYSGGAYIIADAPLDKLPLYVKAGTILPFNQCGKNSIESLDSELELRCYSGQEGFCRLFFDDGISTDYKKGNYSEIEISLKADLRNPDLNIEIIRNIYPLPKINCKLIGG
ncbi:MAG: glycoside hydrolase family 31 protein [Bacillota bacterium]|nr:glycoside hydrolase family 31 protein [Bacillota bacterium]MDW7729417.1 glycoside hydrolase family 31 protein [Bacillota bacterium]